MADDDRKVKKPKPLIKLNGNSNELYDSFGYKIAPPKPPASPTYVSADEGDSHRGASSPERSEPERAAAKGGRTDRKPDSKTDRRTDGKTERRTDGRANVKTDVKTNSPKDTGTAKGAKRASHKQNMKNTKDAETSKSAARKAAQTTGGGGKKAGARGTAEPPHERHITERSIKRRKALIALGKTMIFVLLAACIIVLILHDRNEDEQTPRTAFVTTGRIESTFSADISFIREESIAYAGFSGKLVAAVNEGDRVAAGSVIAYVVKPGYEEDIKNLRYIDNKITAVQNASSYVGVSQNTEMADMNENIKNLSLQLAALSGAGTGMSGYSEIMTKLNDVFNLKNEILVNADSADTYINELKAEREAVLARIKDSMHEIKAEHAGVVSFYVDTKAQSSSEKAAAITAYIDKKGETGNMLSESALVFESTDMRNTVNTDIGQNDAAARITPDVTYYMAADITGKDYSSLTAGKSVSVKGAGREFSADAEVEEILRYGDRQYLLLKSSSGISGAISKRTVQSEIVVDYREGIKIPKRALTDWDSAGLTARITILRSNYVSYVFVNVLAQDSEYAIVSSSNSFGAEDEDDISTVRINDLYVVNYETVTDGQILGD